MANKTVHTGSLFTLSTSRFAHQVMRDGIGLKEGAKKANSAETGLAAFDPQRNSRMHSVFVAAED